MNRISCRFQFCKLTSNYPIYWQMIWIHVSLRSPFNWRTPFGYLLITLIGSVLIFIMLSCAIPSICLTSKYLLSSWWNGTVHSNIIAIFFCIFSCIKCIGSVFPHVDHKQSKCNEWIATQISRRKKETILWNHSGIRRHERVNCKWNLTTIHFLVCRFHFNSYFSLDSSKHSMELLSTALQYCSCSRCWQWASLYWRYDSNSLSISSNISSLHFS